MWRKKPITKIGNIGAAYVESLTKDRKDSMGHENIMKQNEEQRVPNNCHICFFSFNLLNTKVNETILLSTVTRTFIMSFKYFWTIHEK